MARPSPTSKTAESPGEAAETADAEVVPTVVMPQVTRMTLECAHCHAPLGAEAKRAPVSTWDVHGGSPETWCPRCFAWVRAPMEPARYFVDAMTPLSCSLCGWESLALGASRCTQCRSTLTVALGMPRILRP